MWVDARRSRKFRRDEIFHIQRLLKELSANKKKVSETSTDVVEHRG
jgi:hypothetical protein